MMSQFIIDDFTRVRGEPAMLELTCAHCHHYLITYQKDGPGPLLRCYLDRIHDPKQEMTTDFYCPHCFREIGKRGIYEKEQRLAFFLIEGSFEIKELSETSQESSSQ